MQTVAIPLLALITALLTAPLARPATAQHQPPARAMIVVDQTAVKADEPPPHGAIGMSTAYRISDAVPGRTMEFRKRILHRGAAIGPHPIAHDEVYYVLGGAGTVSSGAETRVLKPGMAAYLYAGATVGIRQTGPQPLALIISYPLPPAKAAE